MSKDMKTLTKIKDRELYRHCGDIDEMLAMLSEEIVELEELQELGVEVKPNNSGLLIFTVKAQLNSPLYIDLKSKGFYIEVDQLKAPISEAF